MGESPSIPMIIYLTFFKIISTSFWLNTCCACCCLCWNKACCVAADCISINICIGCKAVPLAGKFGGKGGKGEGVNWIFCCCCSCLFWWIRPSKSFKGKKVIVFYLKKFLSKSIEILSAFPFNNYDYFLNISKNT